MYNGIYPINIHYNYKTDNNKNKVQSKEEENQNQNGNLSNGNASLTQDELQQRYHQNTINYGRGQNFNLNAYQYGNANNFQNIQNRKKVINIHQIVSDFRKTQIAINAPNEVVNEVNKFLAKVDYESNSENPQKNVIQSNLKEASKLLDDYISKTLNKDSHVVEGWLNALFLQDIDYKNNPNDINETFKLKFPKGSKVDEKISENLDILYPNTPSKIQQNEIISHQSEEEATKEISTLESNQNYNNNIISLDKKVVTEEKQSQKVVEQSIQETKTVTLPKLQEEKQTDKTAYTSGPNKTQKNYIPNDEKLKSLFTQAKILGNAKDYQSALNFYEDALNYAHQIKDSQIEPIIYYEVAKVYDKTDNTNTAIEYYANAISTSNDNNNIKALSHLALGKIYDNSSLLDSSLNHYMAACSYGGESENTKLQSFALSDISEIYASIYNKDVAFDFIETAKDIAKETNDSKTIGKIFAKSAKTYKNFNENLQALKDLKVSTIEYDKSTNNFKNQVENYIMAASILIDLNNTEKAKSLLNKATSIINETNLSQYLPQINNLNKLI